MLKGHVPFSLTNQSRAFPHRDRYTLIKTFLLNTDTSFGMDNSQLQELATSFNQFLQQQGILQDSLSHTGSLGTSQSSGHSNSASLNNHSPLLGSAHSVGSYLSGGHSGSWGSTSAGSHHSIPNISITPPIVTSISTSNSLTDDIEDDFDWEKLL